MFNDFATVRDYCHLFLSNSISFNYKSELKLFAFLMPMEYVFEDFLFGFIDKEIPGIRAKSQVRSVYLDQQKIFALRPDLMLDINGKTIIADTKYKIVYTDKADAKDGISQNDLYQMLAYAMRFKVEENILFYPNSINNHGLGSTEIVVQDQLAGEVDVKIRAFQVPVIDCNYFEQEWQTDQSLNERFTSLRVTLKNRLVQIFAEESD